MHLGQRLTLTLLMHPAGEVHLTFGRPPRKALELARDWVAPGLARARRRRCGPGRCSSTPTRSGCRSRPVFGANQVFTRRDTPAAWRDDPILAATQTALLPDGPTSVQDGYIRVMPANGGDG